MIDEYARSLLVMTVINLIGTCNAFRGPHHPHRHYTPQKGGVKLTQDEKLLQDVEHIKEDMGDWMTKESVKKLTPEELEFHYFKAHDFDNNTKLDGLEILQAISHTLDHGKHQDEEGEEEELSENEQKLSDHYQGILVDLIDQVLLEDDTDQDGYISYPEYVIGRKREKRKLTMDSSSRPTV